MDPNTIPYAASRPAVGPANHDGPRHSDIVPFRRFRVWRRVLRDTALLTPHDEALVAQRLAAIEAIRADAA